MTKRIVMEDFFALEPLIVERLQACAGVEWPVTVLATADPSFVSVPRTGKALLLIWPSYSSQGSAMAYTAVQQLWHVVVCERRGVRRDRYAGVSDAGLVIPKIIRAMTTWPELCAHVGQVNLVDAAYGPSTMDNTWYYPLGFSVGVRI